MDISIICPIYNGERYIEKLNTSLLSQEIDLDFDVKYILTESKDNSEYILKKISADFKKISSEEFSHSLVRERAIKESESEVVVLITQDIKIVGKKWLYYLVNDIFEDKCEAAFSRQICENNSIEKYTRMKNYPLQSRIASKGNEKELGVMAYFYSDVSSAIRKEIFNELNGYDGKNLITNEDMYIAYKLIKEGYRIKYCAKSKVIHSHNYKYVTLLKRYFDQGVFLKDHLYINQGANKGALDLVKYTIYYSIKDKNLKAIINIFPNFFMRYIGNKLGQNYKKLSYNMILKLTSNRMYWIKK